MIEELPLPELHTKVINTYYSVHTGSDQHDDFYCLVKTYQYNTTPDRFRELATTCERRLQREADRLPLDLVNAYHRLARLARWRATQLEATTQ